MTTLNQLFQLAVISPDDVVLDSLGLTTELAEAAKALGVEIHEDCNVHKVLIGEGNAVYAAETDDGLVETKAFVSATGLVRKQKCVHISPCF